MVHFDIIQLIFTENKSFVMRRFRNVERKMHAAMATSCCVNTEMFYELHFILYLKHTCVSVLLFQALTWQTCALKLDLGNEDLEQ